MGNEHITDNQLKNSVFMAFGILQEIGKRNIKYVFQSPELMRFGDFVWFLYKMPVDIYQKMSII